MRVVPRRCRGRGSPQRRRGPCGEAEAPSEQRRESGGRAAPPPARAPRPPPSAPPSPAGESRRAVLVEGAGGAEGRGQQLHGGRRQAAGQQLRRQRRRCGAGGARAVATVTGVGRQQPAREGDGTCSHPRGAPAARPPGPSQPPSLLRTSLVSSDILFFQSVPMALP